MSRDLSSLFRQEVALAKAELTESAKKAGKAGGMFGGAGLTALFALLFLSIAAWWGLGYLIGNAWSAVVIAVVYAIVAAILAVRGRREIKEIQGAPQTVETVKEVPRDPQAQHREEAMSTPDEIRADIERTRGELGSDVDALADKVSPSSIAHRQTEKVKSRFQGVRDSVMGSAHSAGSSVSGTASGATDQAKDVAHKGVEKAKGNPLAVGLIAFGAAGSSRHSSPPPARRRSSPASSRSRPRRSSTRRRSR